MAPQKAPAKPKPAPTAPCPPERYAEVGMIVTHYPDLAIEAKPALGIVTAMGMDALDLLVFHAGISGGWPQQGVYHRDHQADKISSDGYWLPRPLDVVLLKLALTHGLLEWDGESRYVPAKKAAETPTPLSSNAGGAATTGSPPPPPPPPPPAAKP